LIVTRGLALELSPKAPARPGAARAWRKVKARCDRGCAGSSGADRQARV